MRHLSGMECRVLGLLKKTAAAKGRVGLAFGREQLAVAVVRRDSGTAVLERCELLPIDPHGGPDAAANAVRAANLPPMPVSTVLRAEDYQLALIEAPDVPPAELRAAMRWHLKDAIDFRVEDAVIDVFDIPVQSRGGQGRMMYAVAARRGAIERYAAALVANPAFDVIDVPELCLRNLASLLPAAANGVALLHLGEVAATIVLVRGATFYFARQMDLQATLRISSGSAPDSRLDAGSVVLELQRSLDYYERHFDQPPITRIAVSPPSVRASELAADLGRETGLEVSTLDLGAILNCGTEIDPATQTACLLAVGAALREEHRSL
jgi:MSHA biogenesis protein MshI